MDEESVYLLAANLLLITHVLFVTFVVIGVVAIYLGAWLGWSWVRNLWFRILHLVSIAVVVGESWVGMVCPLTTWEMQLRAMAGGATYPGSFIQYWLQAILYYDAPEWVFVACYTMVGILILASWFIVRPHGRPPNVPPRK